MSDKFTTSDGKEIGCDDKAVASSCEVYQQVQEFLGDVEPIDMQLAFDITCKNLDITDVSITYKEDLNIIFSIIKREALEGNFGTTIKGSDLGDYSFIFFRKAYKLKNYLNTLGYYVHVEKYGLDQPTSLKLDWSHGS